MKSRSDWILSAIVGPEVLDVGCTGGLQSDRPPMESPTWLHARIAARYDTWGIDLSAEKIHILQSAGYTQTVQADAQDFELNRTFDSIVAGEILEHLENPEGFLRAARRHLKTRGRIVITTPYAQGLPNVLYAWLKYPRTCYNAEHVSWFCPSTLQVLAHRCGLRVTDWRLLLDMPISSEAEGSRLSRWGRPAFAAVYPALPRRVAANCLIAVLQPSDENAASPELPRSG